MIEWCYSHAVEPHLSSPECSTTHTYSTQIQLTYMYVYLLASSIQINH